MATNESKDFQRKPHFTFIWIIENASSLLNSGWVDSPSFIVQRMEKTKWKLSTYYDISMGELCLQISREEDNGPDSIEIEHEISILDDDGSPIAMLTYLQQFRCATLCSPNLSESGDEVFFQRRDEFLPNDELTVRCRMFRTGTEISKSDTCFARTRLGVDRRSFVWAVRDFSSLRKEEKRTRIINPNTHGSPRLILSLFLSERDLKTYLNIQIDHNSETSCHFIICKISVLDSYGRKVHSKETEGLLDEDFQVCTFRKDKIMNDESFALENDVLYLKCEFELVAELVWNRIESYGYSNLEDPEQEATEMLEFQDETCTAGCPFKKTLEDLYGYESLSDVSLRSGVTSLPAHKNILSARSPVFKAMFTQDMREKTSRIVDIPDLNADTLSRLLLYIYKDTVEELQWESAVDLFRAAEKYQLLNLRKKCSVFLKSNLSVYDVCSILSLANMHEAGDLRKAAEDFISEHDNEVFDSNEWKTFKEKNFRLASEIMERIILLMKRKSS
ncbi:Speckle-type POZ protein [Araneus ventricosus]|uniref:Speckle-type POZ protein n=1 Tax=Araneus ventricosus TaxID=182803 RepID=A0A4Y2SM32_ARAVE|nr:Speckle-type POZ protein [Araneus ventricosus]